MNAAKNNSDYVDHKDSQLSHATADKAKMNAVQPDADKAKKLDETPSEKIPATNVQASRHLETGNIRDRDGRVLAEEDKKERQKQIDKEKKRKVFKPGKYILRAKMKHPRRAFQLGRHAITGMFQEFDLNEDEARELGTEGPQAWLDQGTVAQQKQDEKAWNNLDGRNQDSIPL